MKKLILITITALAALFVMQGCEKGRLSDIGGGKIKASKLEINRYETDTLLLTTATATDSLNWTVTPAGQNSVRNQGNVALFSFFKEGTYTVTAQKVSGGATASITIKVSAAAPVYGTDTGTTKTTVQTTTRPDTVDYTPLTGDIKLTTDYFRLPSRDSVILNFNILTVSTYCPKGIVQYTSTVDAAGNFTLDIVNVRSPKNCGGSTRPNETMWVVGVFKNKFIGLGNHQLKVTYNGITYTGTVVVTTTNTTINWNYTSGIVIPDNVINM